MDNDVEMNVPVERVKDPVFQAELRTSCMQLWQEKMTGEMSIETIKDYWKHAVPKFYSPEPDCSCLDWNFDETNARPVLFENLEEYIWGGDPKTVKESLKQLQNQPSVCGHVFKMGEPTYSCRECGMDATCVLCVDCFKGSEHRHHKYKMGTSSGGGCCDCGDQEAWKRDPFCEIHIAGAKNDSKEVSAFPPDVTERTRVMLDAVLWYCYYLLTLEHAPGLPLDLQPAREADEEVLSHLSTPDTYCTVLYNDETHTFEQVIHTLTRVIKCSQKEAIDYVTNIDREGRAVVKCSSFQHCNELKTEIERYTSRHGSRALKVLVMHTYVMAHQLYALKLLSWLQNSLAHMEGFRIVFSEVALKPRTGERSIIEGIMVRDFYLWKAARTSWHRLFISGMLLEYHSKKALATVFTKNYGSIMQDFIRDDHDHAFSISSLSVQIFTVPTLAHYLIGSQDVLFILLNTFISECSRKCNKDGKLEFERNVSNLAFKRAQYILYDLRYLLSSKPEVWTDELRKGFLQGVILILKLLTSMQGMDAVSRQIGQHMEYEPEWESAFNLHIKLAHVLTLVIEWCGTDRVVLIKAYRATLQRLHDTLVKDSCVVSELKELADHSATCYVYDVSNQPVSIHLPLSRFLAGLHLHLEKFGLSYDSQEFAVDKPVPEQIIEPVLRTQSMISQVHAGMWRRNGYALLNQLYFYHNVKCRTEMLDRDIVLLQIGAILIESNEFLIHLLNKFNLLSWISPLFETRSLIRSPEEDSIRQTINLVEEFLSLLITIVGERHTPGISNVTEDERIKKELIQQLCIKPMPHSELNKTLPDDIHHETGMENVIDSIADFKKPTQSTGKGVYELKSSLYNQYNVFFYHYTREELSKSEETQRSRRKQANELECCPPPDLLKLSPSFSMLSNVLQCDVMLHIMNTILTRSTDLRARSFSETQLHKVLHLIGYALQEEESKRYDILTFTSRAGKWMILPLMEELVTSQRVEAHKDLLMWTINKFKSISSTPMAEHQAESEPHSSKQEPNTKQSVTSDKEWRAMMAAQRREKLMAQMASMQNNFIKQNAELFEEAESVSLQGASGEYKGSNMDISDNSDPVCLGPRQTSKSVEQKSYTCILCQEDSIATKDGLALVLSAYVQQSTVLRPQRLDNLPEKDIIMSSNLGPATHTGTCGHVMHIHCWQKYFDNVVSKETRRPYRLRQPASFDVDKQEFLCPLCECLSNTVIPLIPSLQILQPKIVTVDISFEQWLVGLQTTLNLKSRDSNNFHKFTERIRLEHEMSFTLDPLAKENKYTTSIHDVVSNLGDMGSKFEQLYPGESRVKFSETLEHIIRIFTDAIITKGTDLKVDSRHPRKAILLWKSCAYTILSLEMLLRDTDKSLLGDLSSRQRDCVQFLVRICAAFPAMHRKTSNWNNSVLALLSMLFDHEDTCILEWDCFSILVILTFSLPCLLGTFMAPPIQTGGTQESYALKLMLLARITKSLILIPSETTEAAMEVDDVEGTNKSALMKLTEAVKLKINVKTFACSEEKLVTHVKEACRPFLRCCAIFYHFLTDVPVPSNLTGTGEEFDSLCKYLGLPKNFDDLLTSDVSSLILKWCHHPDLINFLNDPKNSPLLQDLPVVSKLVPLPTDYSELINTVSLFTCPNSDRDDSRNPTMCLVCGEMLCSQSYCCQTELSKLSVGACIYHAHKCGAGVGIFLRVRECEILFLASPSRGCFMSPPYLDEYGETDQGLRRGNPLKLCEERYRKLHLLWLSHGVHEEIARSIDSTNNLVATQWQHL